MKALIVVAHPDDHILWMGGTVLTLENWEWHILSLCNSHNDNFGPKLETFKKSCEELKAEKFTAKELRDYQPRELMEIEQPLKIQKEILAFADSKYDLIFTHSMDPNCEYGFHANHVEVRDSVNRLIDEGLLKTRIIFYFCYRSGGSNKPVIADLDKADYEVELTREEAQKKGDLKRLFAWAIGDIQGLSLWSNNEPKIEAFSFREFTALELPEVFVKCKT